MSNRLSGISSLAYQGTNAQQPPNIKRYDRAPTVNDTQNFSLGDFWIHEKSRTSNDSDLYVLMGLAGGIADWDLLSSNNGAVTQFTTDDAVIVIPSNGNVNLSGTHGLNTTGSGDTATFAINNAITLGDLIPIAGGSNALSCITGDINIADGNLKLPNTASDGNSGQIQLGGSRFISNHGTQNTFVGELSGNTTTTGGGTNVGVGYNTLNAITTAAGQVAVGNNALSHVTTAGGSTNVAVGPGSLSAITTTGANVGVGYMTLASSTATQNTSVGHAAAESLISGTDSCFFGFQAGSSYTGAESNNILIGSSVHGTLGESNVTRIGNGTTKTFIAGIRGVTTGAADAVAVLIDSNGQLGTTSSSARYKENIEDMASSSDDLMRLRPVTFQYKKDESKSKRYGLIAEEVAEIFPDLAIFNPDGSPETVKYHEMVPILLNELQKLAKRVQVIEDELMELKGKQ